ncbi:MAG TPA: twin-arginine translocase subunit TatC [Cellvibrio sp.]|nr:twin-arginine translocase subunit TatC [Cellvibrio sp.]
MSTESNDKELPLVHHLLELRTRLLHIIYCLLGSFICLFPFSAEIYALISKPLLDVLPEGASMIATDVASPFLTPMKLTFFVALLISVPFLLYQIWSFIAPGLYKHEKRLAMPLLVSSVLLFFAGMAFAYFVVFPTIFRFMTGIALDGVTTMTDITKYLDFVLHMFFAFGFAFEIPIATILLIQGGVTTTESLTAKRPYIVVGCFVIGMLLTPPDVMSQLLLAVPMWLLFEAGLFCGRLLEKARPKDEDDGDSEASDKTDVL